MSIEIELTEEEGYLIYYALKSFEENEIVNNHDRVVIDKIKRKIT